MLWDPSDSICKNGTGAGGGGGRRKKGGEGGALLQQIAENLDARG